MEQGTLESLEGAVYCEGCEMWLNGAPQWEDHKIGKYHKKHYPTKTRTPKDKNKAKSKPKHIGCFSQLRKLFKGAHLYMRIRFMQRAIGFDKLWHTSMPFCDPQWTVLYSRLVTVVFM